MIIYIFNFYRAIEDFYKGITKEADNANGEAQLSCYGKSTFCFNINTLFTVIKKLKLNKKNKKLKLLK